LLFFVVEKESEKEERKSELYSSRSTHTFYVIVLLNIIIIHSLQLPSIERSNMWLGNKESYSTEFGIAENNSIFPLELNPKPISYASFN